MADGVTSSTDTFALQLFHCDNCDNSFSSRADALNHVWTAHADPPEMPTRCNECNEQFATRSAAHKHQRTTHAAESVTPACPNCSYTAATRDAITEHYWTAHVHETSYLAKVLDCPICTEDATSNLALVRHIDDDHGLSVLWENPPDDEAMCPVCSDTLAHRDGMLQHLATKHQGKLDKQVSYTCCICDASHATRDKANNHVYSQHAPISDANTVATRCTKCHYYDQNEDAVIDRATDRHFTIAYVCPECDLTGSTHDAVGRHYWFTHIENELPVTATTQDTVPRNETLEALYNINKHAKKYARLGTENYRKGKKTTAKANSIKKNALYALKDAVLKRIYPQATAIDIHVIDGSEFYYFDFEDWSFHSPRGKFTLPDTSFDNDDRTQLDDFDVTKEKEHSDKSLKECLLFFSNEFGLNANDYLSRDKLSYGHRSYFIGWDYL